MALACPSPVCTDKTLQAYDMLGVIQQVVDDGQVFEISKDFAKNIITGACLSASGRVVGTSSCRCL